MSLSLKHEKGWFAAGVEVENALKTLSDGAFKLFIHLCLVTPRQTGLLETSQTELARTLNKGNATIRKYLQEMEKNGICRLSGFAPVPYCRGHIQITESYWPYHRRQTPPQGDGVDESVDQVRLLLQDRRCVRVSFSTADEILARKWLEEGNSLERISDAPATIPCFALTSSEIAKVSMLRPGNVHSADRWKERLEPIVARYEKKTVRKYFRGDAAFAKPEIYE